MLPRIYDKYKNHDWISGIKGLIKKAIYAWKISEIVINYYIMEDNTMLDVITAGCYW